jgi:thioredoxin-related protein
MFKPYRIASVGMLSLLLYLCAAAGNLRAEEIAWQTDFDAAKAKAKAEKKLLLVDFTGSDWCGWCIKLKDEVFDKEAFRNEAPKRFVLVVVDFPHEKELPKKLKAQNEKLGDEFKVQGFPTVLMLDADGKLIGRTGYRPDGPKEYVKHLAEMVQSHEEILSLTAKLEKAKGLQRAKLLDRLIEDNAKLENEADETGDWCKEIIALDAQNKAGLKPKYEYRLLMAQFTELKEAEKFDEAKAVIEKIVALQGIGGQQKQDAYFALGEICFRLKDFPGLIAGLKKALDAAPDSPRVLVIQAAITRFKDVAEAQGSIAGFKADLEKAKGLDRARLLGKLIDARTNVSRFVPDEDLSKDVEKWSKEIAGLDPENKTGLKKKYELLSLLTQSERLLNERKNQEALDLLDKLLALPGLTGEQIQEARFLEGRGRIGQKDFSGAIDCLKKSLDAAPDTSRAPMLKLLIQRCESQLAKQKAAKPAKKKEQEGSQKSLPPPKEEAKEEGAK